MRNAYISQAEELVIALYDNMSMYYTGLTSVLSLDNITIGGGEWSCTNM